MSELWEAFLQAIQLIVTLNSEVVEIALRSLAISATAVVLASLICIPVGGLIHFRNFQGKRVLINVIQTFYSIPTVVIGLFVFVFISRAGPLGVLDLMFTPTGIIIGQVILIAPILLGLTISALSGVDKTLVDTAMSLGASTFQITL